jgi:3-oxoacyl-[acyl-carrier protein] reductase
VLPASDALDLGHVPPDLISEFALDRLPIGRAGVTTAELLRLDGKVALVTGGGGYGLGNAICHRLAEQGATIAVLDRELAAAKQTAAELAERFGVRVTAVGCDVTVAADVERAVTDVVGQAGRIDILVNNVGGVGVTPAGAPVSSTRFMSMSADDIDATVAVNLMSALYVTRYVVATMLADSRRGRVVFISSEFGRIGYPGVAVYSASKAALIGLTRTLARELGPEGISPVCVAPGLLVGQRMLDALGTAESASRPFAFASDRASIGRPGVVDEVATIVAFLASSAGAYAHGTTVSIGGGMSD